jgi:hypothetical protein
MSFSETGFVYTYRLVTKWLLPRAGERIKRGAATSQSICPCSKRGVHYYRDYFSFIFFLLGHILFSRKRLSEGSEALHLGLLVSVDYRLVVQGLTVTHLSGG